MYMNTERGYQHWHPITAFAVDYKLNWLLCWHPKMYWLRCFGERVSPVFPHPLWWRLTPGGSGSAGWDRRRCGCRGWWMPCSISPPATVWSGWPAPALHWLYCWAGRGYCPRYWSLSPWLGQAPGGRGGWGDENGKRKREGKTRVQEGSVEEERDKCNRYTCQQWRWIVTIYWVHLSISFFGGAFSCIPMTKSSFSIFNKSLAKRPYVQRVLFHYRTVQIDRFKRDGGRGKVKERQTDSSTKNKELLHGSHTCCCCRGQNRQGKHSVG